MAQIWLNSIKEHLSTIVKKKQSKRVFNLIFVPMNKVASVVFSNSEWLYYNCLRSIRGYCGWVGVGVAATHIQFRMQMSIDFSWMSSSYLLLLNIATSKIKIWHNRNGTLSLNEYSWTFIVVISLLAKNNDFYTSSQFLSFKLSTT